MKSKDELKIIATKGFETNNCIYQIVDFLNKNLKDYGLIFGLTRKDENNIITIYDAENNSFDNK